MVQFDVKRVQKGTESFMVSFDFTKTPVTQIADYIIIAASKHKSSDIHFDPREDGMMVRFRIDGDCQDYTFVPKAYEKNLTTRLKLLANMNITESRLPQDGAIKGMFGDQYLDMRVSALPLNEGEKIVIRILDYSRSLQGVDTLGFHPKNLEKVKRMMGLPNGIILTTGATGSGKSTTTYSMLQGLNKPETNVITVEDPIEMNIEGINQVQVNAEIGMTFAAALRSILRQDPNVILIGEIRDSETAQIAVRSAITGHLVLSTIHTNNALATVERLLDMDVERYLLSTALSGIISQRLAKMLCPDCRYQRETTKYEKKVFKKFMNMDVAHVWDANPKGCDHCRRGYHGRVAIHEVLEINDDIRAAIGNEKLDKKDLAKMVYDGNTITMLQDALIKCLEGTTSFEEVYRNIEIESEDDDNYENEMATEIRDSIPKEEYVPESDDLLDTPVKKDTTNDISSVVVPPAFTAADFAEEETTPEVSAANSANPQNPAVAGSTQSVTPAVNATTPTAVSQTAPTTSPGITASTNPVVTQPSTPPVSQPTAVASTPVANPSQALPQPSTPVTASQGNPVVAQAMTSNPMPSNGVLPQPPVQVQPTTVAMPVAAVNSTTSSTPVIPNGGVVTPQPNVAANPAQPVASAVPMSSVPNLQNSVPNPVAVAAPAVPVSQPVSVVPATAGPVANTNIQGLQKLDQVATPLIPKL